MTYTGKKIAFVITSVISYEDTPLSYSKVRSIYTEEERIKQTRKTVDSIKNHLPDAAIVIAEGGKKNQSQHFEDVDGYLYLGNEEIIRESVDSQYKGIGEAAILLLSLPHLRQYDFIIKISGRYYLNSQFSFDDWDLERFNFRNYEYTGRKIAGKSVYIPGSHSTRLYGVPVKYIEEWKRTLLNCVDLMLNSEGIGIEETICKEIVGERFCYHSILGVEGAIAVDGNIIAE